jgi:predicted ATP-grasp superfamily ATP-dependent carboligase
MRRVLITGARAPAALELARLLHSIDVEVHIADSRSLSVVSASKSVAQCHQLPSPRYAFKNFSVAVEKLVQAHKIDLVIPTCEEVFYLAAARDKGGQFNLFAPAFTTLEKLHNKFKFIELAETAGVTVPKTVLLTAPPSPTQFMSQDVVFKPVYSRFGEALKYPQEIAQFIPTPDQPWVAQQRLQGEELCTYAIAREGHLQAMATYRPTHRMGGAASFYFEPVEDRNIEEMVGKIVAATCYTGQIAFDVFRTPNGEIMPIECNPRATSGIHLLANNIDVANLFIEKRRSSTILRVDTATPTMLASAMVLMGLPQSILKNPVNWWRDFNRARDVLKSADENLNLRAILVFIQMLIESVRRRITFRELSTDDLEWNGEDIT